MEAERFGKRIPELRIDKKKETSSTQEHLKSDDEEARIREKMPQGSLEKEGISR